MTKSPDKSPAALLSNGRMLTLVTGSGSGFTQCDGLALTRWSGDRVEDSEGSHLYLRDLDSGEFWSVGLQPAGRRADAFQMHASPGLCTLERRDGSLKTTLEIAVSAEANVEIRRLRIYNEGTTARRIEVTSYMDVVLNHAAADASHPAFSKLFVQTRRDEARGLLLARRRPRGANELRNPVLWQRFIGAGATEMETDRVRFIGRGRSLAQPAALADSSPLSGTAGNVLDPAFAQRKVWRIAPQDTAEGVLLLGLAPDESAAAAAACSAAYAEHLDQTFAAARSQGEAQLAQYGLDEGQGAYFAGFAAAMLYQYPQVGPSARIRIHAAGSPPAWNALGIPLNGPRWFIDGEGHDPDLLPLVLSARNWLKTMGLAMPLVLVSAKGPVSQDDGIAVLSPEAVDADTLAALEAQAAGVIRKALPPLPPVGQGAKPMAPPRSGARPPAPIPSSPLRFWNGHGGFSDDGREYVIPMSAGAGGTLHLPPLPWVNVIANENFGLLVSESGAGCTWSVNSREHRLTPWSNDPVMDPPSECFYLRDDARGEFWSTTPAPAPSGGDYQAAHGFGYSRFTHQWHDLTQETTVFVDRHAPVRLTRIRVRNTGRETRQLSLWGYHRLVLGGTPQDSAAHGISEFDPATETLLAVNPLAGVFAGGVTFAAAAVPADASLQHGADRASFLGPLGSLAQPAALVTGSLNNITGAALDPCAALRVQFSLAPAEEAEITFLLGEAPSRQEALALSRHFRSSAAVSQSLAEVQEFWHQTLEAVQVRTPSPAIDLMLNGWLLYQNLSCRIWGRSAFYQSGGAFGFRDQLQDSSALMHARPDLARQQIVLHAGHQFPEGDVLHWWHPAPLSRGMRTRFADDLLWLPLLTAHYLSSTGDTAVLDETAPFVTAPKLAPGEDEVFIAYGRSTVKATVYEHCCRAIDRAMEVGLGSHGLPLMGVGDWNDGMNRVGREGKGESVWMGFFLILTIAEFLPHCAARNDGTRVQKYDAFRTGLLQAVNDAGWDGDWYRRAYYDNGAPLGSRESDECRIDALAQAWSVISGAAPADRARQAMDAVMAQLVSEKDRLVRLLTPAFVDTPHDPGYIKGYVAGVRENGGQYTHAACWVVRALAEMGRGNEAASLLEMLSPISHALTPADVALYKVEPYVIAADIYGEPPHVGRGGWTWYTGSAGWMYRAGLESVLGVTKARGRGLRVAPAIPDHWPGFEVSYRLPDGKTSLRLEIVRAGPGGQVSAATLDGKTLALDGNSALLPLVEDGQIHTAQVTVGG